MRFASLLLLYISLASNIVISQTIDSIKILLDQLPLDKRFDYIEQLPFTYIVKTGKELVPLLLQYEQLAIENRKTKTLAKINTNFNLIYYYAGEYDKSIDYGLNAIHLYDSLGDKSNLGVMYGEVGYQMKRRNLSRAFELMKKGLLELKLIGEPASLAKIYDNYGVLHEMNNNVDSAMFFYRKALSIKLKLNDSIGIPFSYNNIAAAFLIKKEYDSAKYYINKSTSIRSRNHDLVGLAENFSYLGQIYASFGYFNDAIKYNQQALDLAKKHNYLNLQKVTYQNLSQCYENLKDYQRALFFHQKYKQCEDSILNIETNKIVANLEIKYKTAEKENELTIKNQQYIHEKSIKIYIATILVTLIIALIFLFWGRTQIAKRNEKLKVRNALLEGEQNERNRLALELHDGIANDLNASIIALRGQSNLDNEIEKLKEIHQVVRKMSHTLMPRCLTEQGLDIALRELLLNYSNLNVSLQTLNLDKRLNSFVEFNVYRIVQESLNNIDKHAQTQDVFLECNRIENTLILTVEDNGKGFEIENTNGHGIGIKNIQNRVKMMNGVLNIKTALNKGTSIEIQIPIK